jgi:sulfopyruvate decarboxylase TPP-binding subunit
MRRTSQFLLLTLRGAVGDHHKHHVSNGLYLRSVLEAINMPYQIIDTPADIPCIARCYRHTGTCARPMTVLLTRDLLLRGDA